MTPWRWVLTVLSFAAGIGASVYIVLTSWPGGRTPAVLPPAAHVAALGAMLLEIIARTGRSKLTAISLKIPASFEAVLRSILGGDFAAAITPGRVGTEPARFLVLAEAGTPTPSVLLLLYAEALQEVLSLIMIVGVFAFLFHDVLGGSLSALIGLIGAHAALIFGVGGVGVLLARRNTSGPPPLWAERLGLNAGRWRAVQRWLRRLRSSIAGIREVRWSVALLAFGATMVHVLARLAILPLIVFASGATPPLVPLLIWPLAFIYYGGVIPPVPGGGGLVEIAFRIALGGTIPSRLLGATLIWWRFYTFYAYIMLGALAAGGTVLRALRSSEGEEEAEEDVAAGQLRGST